MKLFGYQSIVLIGLLIFTTTAAWGNTIFVGPLTSNETDQRVHWYLEGGRESFRSTGGLEFSGGVDTRLSNYFTVDTALTLNYDSHKYQYKDNISEFCHDWFSFIPNGYLNYGFTAGDPKLLAFSFQHTIGDGTDKGLITHVFELQENQSLLIGAGAIHYYYDLGTQYGVSKSPLYVLEYHYNKVYTRFQYIRKLNFGLYDQNAGTITPISHGAVTSLCFGYRF